MTPSTLARTRAGANYLIYLRQVTGPRPPWTGTQPPSPKLRVGGLEGEDSCERSHLSIALLVLSAKRNPCRQDVSAYEETAHETTS